MSDLAPKADIRLSFLMSVSCQYRKSQFLFNLRARTCSTGPQV